MYVGIESTVFVLAAIGVLVATTDAGTRYRTGTRCPANGRRNLIGLNDNPLIMRGLDSEAVQDVIVELLNLKRSEETFTTCYPLFSWDADLARSAQAWADQCALVEYDGSVPSKLHHDPWLRRSKVVRERPFAIEPGVAQTVHWAKTHREGIGSSPESVVKPLLESELTIEEGLIDGLGFARQDDSTNFLSWGQATHVGCGWIQFPSSSDDDESYDNFMVCNYGIGVPTTTTCTTSGSGLDSNVTAYVTYYSVSEDVIRDVKGCLGAVRCRKRTRGLTLSDQDPCAKHVDRCLEAKSGLRFAKSISRFRGVARSSQNSDPVDLVASRCKIDTILCGLNGTRVCKERLRKCLPMLNLNEEGSDDDEAEAQLPECECADLKLADGAVGDCSGDDDSRFCFVKQSPCVDIDETGNIRRSTPYGAANDLIHMSREACLST